MTALAALALSVAPEAQPQGPTFRSGVQLVDVDVVVFDKTTGKPVRGLTASDFTIVDRKQTRPIATFSEVDYSHDPHAAVLPPGVALDVADNRSAAATRLVLLVVDDLHIAESVTDRTKQVLRQVLRDLGPQATIGLTFTSGQAGVEMTDDRAQVYRQIEAFKGRQKLRHGGAMPTPGDLLLAGMPGPTAGPMVAHVNHPTSDLADEDYWLANSLHGVLAREAAVLGTETLRRKAIVLVSEGVPVDLRGLFEAMTPRPTRMSVGPPGPAQSEAAGADMDSDLLSAMDAMRRANVALYAIDPGAGVASANVGSAADRPLMSADPVDVPAGEALSVLRGWDRSATSMTGDYLTSLADFSGGFAIANSDHLEAGLQTLLGDLDHYYMLGFEPPLDDTQWHELEVMTDVKNAVVRARRGYQLRAASAPPKNTKEPLAGFSSEVLPATDLALKMFATPLASPGQKETRLALTIQVHADRDVLRDPDGQLRDTLHMLTLAVDLRSQKLTRNVIKRERFVTLAPKPGDVLPSDVAYQIVSEWSLPPGHYQLRTTVESDRLQKSGSVYLTCDVPDYRKRDVALSGVVIGMVDPSRHVAGGTAVEHGLLPIEPVLEREFASSDVLRLAYDVWRRTTNDAVTTSLVILDDARHVVRQSARTIASAGGGHVDVTVPLAGLAPGPYVLAITAADAARKKSDAREIGFFVR